MEERFRLGFVCTNCCGLFYKWVVKTEATITMIMVLMMMTSFGSRSEVPTDNG